MYDIAMCIMDLVFRPIAKEISGPGVMVAVVIVRIRMAILSSQIERRL